MKTMLCAGALALALPAATLAQATGQTAALNECLLPPVPNVADLLPCGLSFTALGEVHIKLTNHGTVGVNTPERAMSASVRTAVADPNKKIRIDLYVADKLVESLYHPALAGGSSKEMVAKIPSNYASLTPRCGESKALKVVVDAQNQFAESSESNNTWTRQADRPCPDMEVESIQANYNNLKTEFVAEIRITNRGNAPARFRYLALTSNSQAFGPLPSADFDKLMEIDAGQTKKFTIGNSFANGKMYVRVFLDRFNDVAELGVGNNFKEKTLP